MEPVPETERMEEFKASPVPTLRLPEATLYELRTGGDGDGDVSWRLPAYRRATDPEVCSNPPRSPTMSPPSLPFRPRNTSPFNRGHLRSRSTTSPLAPPMSRAHSMPRVDAAGNLITFPPQRPASPAGSPSRLRRKPVDEVFPGSPSSGRNLKGISETEPSSSDGHTPRGPERSSSPLGLPYSTSLPRRRRPSSPLRHGSQSTPVGAANANALTPTTPNSATSSPLYQTSRFESFLGTSSYPGSFASSSVPSTPTSARSRSPSISSLETIPDSPDAEIAALEADRIAQLQAAADAADGGETVAEAVTPRGRTLGLGSRDKRKRWSVCGAERRGDLNLDTIWED
jgi:hypothetical protein